MEPSSSNSWKSCCGNAPSKALQTLSFGIFRLFIRINSIIDSSIYLFFQAVGLGLAPCSDETFTFPAAGRWSAVLREPADAGRLVDRQPDISAIVPSQCVVQSAALPFGTYAAGAVQQNAQIGVHCSNGTSYTVSLDAGTGSGASVASRKLSTADGVNTLNYGLYQDAGRTRAWGNSNGSDTVSGVGNGSSQSLLSTATSRAARPCARELQRRGGDHPVLLIPRDWSGCAGSAPVTQQMQYAMAWAFFEATPFLYARPPAQQLPYRKLFVDYWSHS
jgi:spore coat protein U-like protein